MNGQTATAPPHTVITLDGAAEVLSTYLKVLPLMFVQVMRLAGMPVTRAEVTGKDEGLMAHPQADALGVPDGTPGRWRAVYLVTEEGLTVADATLIWLPDESRIPAEALAALDEGAVPAGHILAPLGITRERRAAVQHRPGEGVHSHATLMLRGLPVALAYEVTTVTALQRMAEGWSRSLHGSTWG